MQEVGSNGLDGLDMCWIEHGCDSTCKNDEVMKTQLLQEDLLCDLSEGPAFLS